MLKEGSNIEESIIFTKKQDEESHYRQVSGLDKDGNAYAFTGEALKFWDGKAAHVIGDKYVVMGNQLDDAVLESMANVFENSKGTLAERLLGSLLAGQKAGGQISGKQSAALVVKGLNNDWYNQIDLRVDHSDQPFEELQVLMNYHYGRIRLNQSIFAHGFGNTKRAKNKLIEAEELLNGWNGMYGKIAYAHSLLGNDEQAVKWMKKGLSENPNWKVNLPAFYYLSTHKELKSLIKPETFSTKNWENAIQMLIRLKRYDEAIRTLLKINSEGMNSSYLQYLLGFSYRGKGRVDDAKRALNEALILDKENVEAEILLDELNTKPK